MSNKKNTISNPHDLFLKTSLMQPGAVEEFARLYFPREVLRQMDFSSLKLTNKSYVVGPLKELHSDLVFSFKIQEREGYAYFLLEHQSSPDPLMAFRFVKYNVALLEDHLKEIKEKKKKSKLPLLVNICLYHNANKKPYPYSTSVYDLFENAHLSEELGIFTKFHLVDLNSIPDREIETHKNIHLMEKLLKYSRHRDLLNVLKEELDRADVTILLESEYWRIVAVYASQMMGKMDESSQKEFVTLFKDKFNKTEEEIMETMAQAIAKDYAEKYLAPKIEQRAMQTRDLAIAKNMLKEGSDVGFIQKITGLTQEIIETLKQE